MPVLISKKRLIVSGEVVELFEYRYPYAFNFVPVSGGKGREMEKLNPRREDNLREVRNQIRRLVESNYKAYGFEPCFLTFTFRDNVTEVDRATKLFTDFIRRFKYHTGLKLRYLAVTEFQKRGAVHFHCIFFNLPLSYETAERSNRYIANIWQHGFIDIERIRSAKRVGPYVSKYLDKAVMDKRLIGKKAYFTSRGLLQPKEYRIQGVVDKQFAKLYRMGLQLQYVSNYGTSGGNRIIYKQYERRGVRC